MATPVIDASGLGRRFASVMALADVGLTVAAGESVAVFGPNGAGKTTLLRLLATLLRPTAGELRLFGQSLRDGGLSARRRTGMLSHQSFLYPDLTPFENLEFYARMYRVPAAATRVRELIDAVGLAGWAHQPVRTLSRGLEQRAALARALLHEPELLLLDEPFTGLDLDAGAMLCRRLCDARGRGATVLMTTHDLARGLELCDRGIILARGRVAWAGNLAGTTPGEFSRLYDGVVQRSRGA
jgi:heme exporter protein A